MPIGLSSAQALERLRKDGPNALAEARGRTLFDIARETMREPMFFLLLSAAGLYLVLGEIGEGVFLLFGAAASIGLVILQEARSENALAALRALAQPHARVLRDGAQTLVPSRDLVIGDVLFLGEGDRVPADAMLAAGDVLSVDESAMTGESAPVSKRIADPNATFPDDAAPGAEVSSFLFSGTLVTRGQGLAVVGRTGARSALGQISRSLADIDETQTPLQKAAGKIVVLLGGAAVAFCAVVVLAYGVLRSDWIAGALAGLTVAISLIPEEFPMVLAIFMALGAWRLATHQVLVRRSAVVEALGGATMLCVDKTGTLTENRMRVARLWTEAGVHEPNSDHSAADRLLRAAALASSPTPVDPMDRAVRALRPAAPGSAPTRTWPLTTARMAMVQLWSLEDGATVAAKGAPEAVLRLCGFDPDAMRATIERFAEDGLRVLAVADAKLEPNADLDSPEAAPFAFAGLVGFLDPIRADARPALEEAAGAGIGVAMITGDHPATARAIAAAAGIDVSGGVMLGSEIDALSASALGERVRGVRVFARVQPEQKLKLVEAFKANGGVVAMTGDGVNDAPALEAADIGIAMGRRGSDVAREAADLVLLDDSFASIVGGVRLGRRIFANLRKALTYITAIHVPIAGLALAPVLFGMPQLLFPMHVVLMELAIDPTCALAFEGEHSSDDAMKRPPRRRDDALFGPRQAVTALLQGLVVFLGTLGLYAGALTWASVEQARGAAFLALVLGNLTLALVDAAGPHGRVLDGRRRIYWIIAGALVAILATVLGVPALATLFQMAAPPPILLATAIGVALTTGGAPWLIKRLRPAQGPAETTIR